MYSSFHCLCSFELVTHYNAHIFFVNQQNFMFSQNNNRKHRKEGQKPSLIFVQFGYIFICMLYLKYNIPSFLLVFLSFSIQKIRKVCQFFTLLPLAPQSLPPSDRNVQREYPRKYTDGAYPSPVPDHTHSTSRR